MRILLVEDSPRMAQVVEAGLAEEGYAVETESDGLAGLRRARTGDYDLILLDINLPSMDGFEFLDQLRTVRSDVPVICVTARDEIEDRTRGLDLGADDYVVKPFAFEELLARIRAVMRRPGARKQPVLEFNDIRLDPGSGRATRGGETLSLSAREYSLLRVFMENPGDILPRAKLYESVWNMEYDGTTNVLDVYINHLRNKLEELGDRVIHTERGRGYCLGGEI